ncbi:MAG: hypothetical protein DRH50_08205 [Deltaproteobacteria bacterium]|nr:MAG: hypothetical protein DRH50_08205 [Deltaproteobacteria bacterium]
MEPGTKVIIRQNPHHPIAVDIVGIVIRFRPGKGFGGTDLVDVRYKHPKTGKRHTMPVNCSCPELGTPAALTELAERYEAIAFDLRKSAE